MQRDRNSPGEATHLAVTFRLTEAYTGAKSGWLTAPTALPETRPLSTDTLRAAQPAGLGLQRPRLARSGLIGGTG